jgi:hypothetical protein
VAILFSHELLGAMHHFVAPYNTEPLDAVFDNIPALGPTSPIQTKIQRATFRHFQLGAASGEGNLTLSHPPAVVGTLPMGPLRPFCYYFATVAGCKKRTSCPFPHRMPSTTDEATKLSHFSKHKRIPLSPPAESAVSALILQVSA